MSATDVVGAASPRARASRRVRAHIVTPLHRDAYALVVNSAFTAATGLVYWIFAAKTYDANAVGINSALISAMMFLAGTASLDLPNLIVRFLPGAGVRTARYVVLCYVATGVIAAVAAIVFLVGVGAWAPRLRVLDSSFSLEAWFVVSTTAWCLFVIQDGVLTALGRAVLVPVENAVFSVAKLGMLVAFAALSPLYGIFISWTVAMIATVAAVNLLILGRLARRPRVVPRDPATFARGRGLGRYFALDYAGAIAWLAAVNLMPVVVTEVAGATVNAHFALAWAVAFPLYAVSANIGTSLVLHGAADRMQLPVLLRKALRQGIAVLVPGIVIVTALAPLLLSLFGEDYAENGTTLLRLLAIGSLGNLVLALGISVARVEGRLGKAVAALWTQAVLALGLAVPLVSALGVTGPGVAWLISQAVVGVGLVAAGGLRLDAGAGARLADLRARAGETASGALARRARAQRLARRLLAAHPELEAAEHLPRVLRTDSDVVVARAGRSLVVKIAWSPAGAGALAAQRASLAAVRALPDLGELRPLLPLTLAEGVAEDRPYVIERALRGVDGRRFTTTHRAVEATAAGAAALHTASGRPVVVDERLVDRLVRARTERLAAACRPRARASLRALDAELETALLGRTVTVARSHGDLWLGNALLEDDGSRLTGLVDWEASRAADLPGVDLAHLVVSTRALRTGAGFGTVIHRLLHGTDELTPAERRLLEGPLGERELLLLAWLQHVVQRLTQTTLHHHGRWMRRNVDPVLAAVGS